MSEHTARVDWQRGAEEVFTDNRYQRRHTLQFDGGAQIAGSSSPHSVPLPWSDASAVDPEELFVASLSSCHMLWFLSLAARAGHVIDSYSDSATGTLARDARGRMAMTQVTLRPRVAFGGAAAPDATALDALHHAAHAACFIANSVACDVRCEPQR